MDPLAEIRSKLERLPKADPKVGLEAVLRHLELAEAHYERGRAEQNDDWFNDAVYRANQAYEGALKEAWRVLRDAEPKRKKTHELEKGLTQAGVLTDRAKGLLENYRQNWRNPSTHDHTQLFGEQDAFLALWSVVAFVAVLFDQIVSRLSEDEAQSELGEVAREVEIRSEDEPGFLAEHLQEFARTEHAFFDADGAPRSEAETLGWLTAFLKRALRDARVEPYPKLESGRMPDLLLTRGDERLVVELKRGGSAGSSLRGGTIQLIGYLKELGLSTGALILGPSQKDEPMSGWVDIYQGEGGRLIQIVVLGPSSLSPEFKEDSGAE